MAMESSNKGVPMSDTLKPGTLLLTCEPFVYVGRLKSPKTICDTCLVIEAQHKRCSSCQDVWYCNETCQKKGWKAGHKYECKMMGMLNLIPENQARTVTWMARMLLRLIVKLQDGKDHFEEFDVGGTKVKRRFEDLMSNYEELRKNAEHMVLVEMIIRIAKLLLGSPHKITIPCDAQLHEICGRVLTNAFEISNGSIEVGSGIYLASSIFNHSCNQMAVRTFEGTRMFVRNIREIPKSLPIDKVTVSYTSALLPSWERRKKLKNWYFHCECERCETGQFDKEMRSIICRNKRCHSEIDTLEMRNPCSACGHVMKEEAVVEVLDAEDCAIQYLKSGNFDLQSLEACISKLKANNFSDTHWLLIDLFEKAFGAAERISRVTRNSKDIKKTYDYGSKYLLGVKRYLQPYDIERLRTLVEIAYFCPDLNKIEEAKKLLAKAKPIAEVVYGKNSNYVRTHIDSVVPMLGLLGSLRKM